MINLCSLRGEHIKNVSEALEWCNESNPMVAKVVAGEDTLEIDRSIQSLCPFLSDLIDSLPVSNCEPVIILPEFSSTTFKHFAALLTLGYTEACKDVKAVEELAKILNIALDDLVTNTQHLEDLEEGEIVDSDISLSQEPPIEMADTTSSNIKIAAFSRVFISVPNSINNNSDKSLFQCLECDRSFSKPGALKAHIDTTTKHEKISKNTKKTLNKSNPALNPVVESNAITTPWSIQSSGQLSTDILFSYATGVAVSLKGEILVVDSGNKWVQVFHPDRTPKIGFYLEAGKVTQDKIAVCPKSSYIVVLEAAPKAQLKVISQSGNLINVFGNAYLQNPKALIVDRKDRILVVDEKSGTVFIFSLFGELLDRIPCPGLGYPTSVEVVGQEMILVSDYQTHCVMVYDFSGNLKMRLGGPGICTRPSWVLMSKSGNVIVADRQSILVKLSVFSLDGQLLGTIKSDIDQHKVKDIALTSDGNLVVLYKDFLSFSNLGDAAL